jgi:hypothetical protein
MLAQEVEKEFEEKAGYDPAAKPLIGSWNPEDDEGFIR